VAQTFYRMVIDEPEDHQPHGLHIAIDRVYMQWLLNIIGDAIASNFDTAELEFWGTLREDRNECIEDASRTAAHTEQAETEA
jgi:hypothetical protein